MRSVDGPRRFGACLGSRVHRRIAPQGAGSTNPPWDVYRGGSDGGIDPQCESFEGFRQCEGRELGEVRRFGTFWRSDGEARGNSTVPIRWKGTGDGRGKAGEAARGVEAPAGSETRREVRHIGTGSAAARRTKGRRWTFPSPDAHQRYVPDTKRKWDAELLHRPSMTMLTVQNPRRMFPHHVSPVYPRCVFLGIERVLVHCSRRTHSGKHTGAFLRIHPEARGRLSRRRDDRIPPEPSIGRHDTYQGCMHRPYVERTEEHTSRTVQPDRNVVLLVGTVAARSGHDAGHGRGCRNAFKKGQAALLRNAICKFTSNGLGRGVMGCSENS
eukprot:scaffold287_cov337-Pavlova_lutheri.AAC.66